MQGGASRECEQSIAQGAASCRRSLLVFARLFVHVRLSAQWSAAVLLSASRGWRKRVVAAAAAQRRVVSATCVVTSRANTETTTRREIDRRSRRSLTHAAPLCVRLRPLQTDSSSRCPLSCPSWSRASASPTAACSLWPCRCCSCCTRCGCIDDRRRRIRSCGRGCRTSDRQSQMRAHEHDRASNDRWCTGAITVELLRLSVSSLAVPVLSGVALLLLAQWSELRSGSKHLPAEREEAVRLNLLCEPGSQAHHIHHRPHGLSASREIARGTLVRCDRQRGWHGCAESIRGDGGG